jgi:hypothetical protein
MGSLETTKITGDFTMIAQPAIPISISGEQCHGSSKQQKKVQQTSQSSECDTSPDNHGSDITIMAQVTHKRCRRVPFLLRCTSCRSGSHFSACAKMAPMSSRGLRK